MELREDITEFVRIRIALGEEPAAAIVKRAVEHLEHEADPETITSIGWQVVGQELATHTAAQATWADITDSDRLTLAFAALDAHGVTAREDFTCCQSCGQTEIGGEAAEDARGYTFYHRQDAEGAASGGPLFLAYGTFGQVSDARIGAEIVAELHRQGLDAEWNGDVGRRIKVPMRWQRRRTGDLAELPPPGLR